MRIQSARLQDGSTIESATYGLRIRRSGESQQHQRLVGSRGSQFRPTEQHIVEEPNIAGNCRTLIRLYAALSFAYPLLTIGGLSSQCKPLQRALIPRIICSLNKRFMEEKSVYIPLARLNSQIQYVERFPSFLNIEVCYLHPPGFVQINAKDHNNFNLK